MMPQNIFAQRALGTPMAARPPVMQQVQPQPASGAVPVMQRPVIQGPQSTAMPAMPMNAMQRFAMPGQTMPGQANGAPAAQIPPQIMNAMRMRMGM